jgi:two-component system, OmpR family, sensor histidine kinase CpxA
MKVRYPLWLQIGTALVLNLVILALAGGVVLWWQTNAGLTSFLYAPARERVRELGMRVEAEFPDVAPEQRSAWLADVQKPYGITLTILDDTGRLVAGPNLPMPPEVREEVVRTQEDRPRRSGGGRRGRQPMFLVKGYNPTRYWIGYHFPVVLVEGRPPVRHTLAVVSGSILTNSFFFDWRPWTWGALAACALTALCWWPLARRLGRSIRSVQTASGKIASGNFDVQVPVSGRDELADLGMSVNRMATQLAQLIHGQRRFLADVAHELCAPLSRIQLSAGILAHSAHADARAVERLERDVSHMSALVGDLLSFTKGNVRLPQLEVLSVHSIVKAILSQEVRANIGVFEEIPPDLIVLADREYLARAVSNIIRNAIQYAGAAGPINIRAERTGSMVRLTVEDEGPGLPDKDLASVFAPFYRPDVARSAEAGGAGLGLAIVRECLTACGGSVTCENRKPKGLAVTILIPAAPEGSV